MLGGSQNKGGEVTKHPQYTRGEVAKRRGGREQSILFENVTLYNAFQCNGGSLQVSVEAYLALKTEKVRLAGVRWRALKSTPQLSAFHMRPV